MIQTTRWTPDTCDCIMEYQWDDKVAADKRVHTASKTVRACAFHQGHPDKESHMAAVLTENQLKNTVIGAITDDHPDVKEALAFSYDDDRKLQIEVKGADAAKKQAIVDSVEAEVGTGKVEII